MENEYQVLSHLQDNESTTQRGIAKRTGLSLGAVNILLKKMAKKGLVKIEGLNARTMRYILTPRGMQEKTRQTYRFIKSSYRQIINIIRSVKDNLTDITVEEKHSRGRKYLSRIAVPRYCIIGVEGWVINENYRGN